MPQKQYFALASDRYAAVGVDVERAMAALQPICYLAPLLARRRRGRL